MITSEDVRMAYRLFLDREPESGEVIDHHLRLASSTAGLRRIFLDSAEYKAKAAAHGNASTANPPATDTKTDWEIIGAEEPFHGVLTHEKFLRRNLDQEALNGFWKTGEDDIAYIGGIINRLMVNPFRPGLALDFGCGVGRQTRAMARVAKEVIGFDISAGMLAEAQKYAAPNVRFVDVLPEGPFDWINSAIVFQHIPPSDGYLLFGRLLDRLAPGGVFSVQVTIFRDSRVVEATVSSAQDVCWDGETMRALRWAPWQPGEMQMYDYDLNRVLALAVQRGVPYYYLDHTDHGGYHGVHVVGKVPER